jgi:hypothetical protein
MADYNALMREAKDRVASFDRIDHYAEYAQPLAVRIKTVMCALEAAIKTGNWTMVADAQVMLQQIREQYA